MLRRHLQRSADVDILASICMICRNTARVRSCSTTGVRGRPQTVGIQSYQQQCQQCTLFCQTVID